MEFKPGAADEASEGPSDLEGSILQGRRFTMAEAIGRSAGPGMMRGGSPISRHRQAIAAAEEALKDHLDDPEGVLLTLLRRRVADSRELMRMPEQPLVALESDIRRILDSASRLKELVREVDAAWGRQFDEPPFFDRDGQPPHPDDPYPLDGVRRALTSLADSLARTLAGESGDR
ncbi:hypothetical protein EVJ50_04200 [Synechococcus sp. RSCCF101]|uniref:hypothetical protein n=1 Tax=Synechococcus sp. RSCCF101 TaxID=2511069 RepID=UPI0012472E2B|nr:hypothetical protein [Synechococcus sp. RSCCF101]QEY31574.1 hypothetical protein EVJ50_04200 [Synechococcus sp. RSCCF101]